MALNPEQMSFRELMNLASASINLDNPAALIAVLVYAKNKAKTEAELREYHYYQAQRSYFINEEQFKDSCAILFHEFDEALNVDMNEQKVLEMFMEYINLLIQDANHMQAFILLNDAISNSHSIVDDKYRYQINEKYLQIAFTLIQPAHQHYIKAYEKLKNDASITPLFIGENLFSTYEQYQIKLTAELTIVSGREREKKRHAYLDAMKNKSAE